MDNDFADLLKVLEKSISDITSKTKRNQDQASEMIEFNKELHKILSADDEDLDVDQSSKA